MFFNYFCRGALQRGYSCRFGAIHLPAKNFDLSTALHTFLSISGQDICLPKIPRLVHPSKSIIRQDMRLTNDTLRPASDYF